MKEIWKDVVGYKGYYKVSNLGRVKRLVGTNVRINTTKKQRSYLNECSTL